jgi:RimJ/RimL family protein N-acetyltransferase
VVAPAADSSPPQRIEAGPVVLRRLRATDAGAIAAAVGASLDYLRPWMPWATPAAADRRSQLTRVAEADQWWEAGIRYTYSVLAAAHGTLVGEVALHRQSARDSAEIQPWAEIGPRAEIGSWAEIGYWIAASQSGRGYGTSAADAITRLALRLPGVVRAEIHCDIANGASSAIARKAGYRLDRIERREPETPGETGRLMIWVRDSPGGGAAQAG